MGVLTKIVLTGPESSGKSQLCRQLAEHFQAPFASEYARIFLEQHGPGYDFAMLDKIRSGHHQHQQSTLSRPVALAFLDTDLINFLVWEKLVFAQVHNELVDELFDEIDHHYLICYPDLPWTPDPLRENPENRIDIFEAHRREIEKRGRSYRIVKGHGFERFKNAIAAVEELLAENAGQSRTAP